MPDSGDSCFALYHFCWATFLKFDWKGVRLHGPRCHCTFSGPPHTFAAGILSSSTVVQMLLADCWSCQLVVLHNNVLLKTLEWKGKMNGNLYFVLSKTWVSNILLCQTLRTAMSDIEDCLRWWKSSDMASCNVSMASFHTKLQCLDIYTDKFFGGSDTCGLKNQGFIWHWLGKQPASTADLHVF